MKNLNEMTVQELNFVRQKIASRQRDIDLDIIRSQERLDSKLLRQEVNQDTLDALKQQLIDDQNILAHMQNTNADAALIAKQQARVDETQQEVDLGSKGVNVLTEDEAYMQQFKIDMAKTEEQLLADRIVEIDALLGA